MQYLFLFITEAATHKR